MTLAIVTLYFFSLSAVTRSLTTWPSWETSTRRRAGAGSGPRQWLSRSSRPLWTSEDSDTPPWSLSGKSALLLLLSDPGLRIRYIFSGFEIRIFFHVLFFYFDKKKTLIEEGNGRCKKKLPLRNIHLSFCVQQEEDEVFHTDRFLQLRRYQRVPERPELRQGQDQPRQRWANFCPCI